MTTIAQRIYLLERRSGIKQDGSCGWAIFPSTVGSNCGKQTGHADRGDPQHVPALDPSFVPWGPDWQDPISGLPPVSEGRAAAAMLRGFERGITNDPPDNCPDLPFYTDEASGSYTEGMRLGKELSHAGHGIDRSSTLIVQGCPDGTEVICVPQPFGIDVAVDQCRKEVTPLRRAIGSPANWNIYVPSMLVKNSGDCPFVGIGIEPNCLITIDFSKGTSDMLQGRYGVGPFKSA